LQEPTFLCSYFFAFLPFYYNVTYKDKLGKFSLQHNIIHLGNFIRQNMNFYDEYK